MLKATLLFLSTSYFAWYMERYELSIIYPFDASYATPTIAGEPRLSEVRIQTSDGEQLIVWRAQAMPDKPTLVYFPGNAGGLRDRADRFSWLIDEGYGVTALAYRGSSGSSGRPEEVLLVEDALAIVAAETGRPRILYGESLGTAVAIKLAASGLGEAVVLEAPFTSVTELIQTQYPDETLDHLITQRWESLVSVPFVRQPLLVIHGSQDRLVPIRMGRQIFDQAGSAKKQFIEVAGRGHSGLWTAETRVALIDFLDQF